MSECFKAKTLQKCVNNSKKIIQLTFLEHLWDYISILFIFIIINCLILLDFNSFSQMCYLSKTLHHYIMKTFVPLLLDSVTGWNFLYSRKKNLENLKL